MGQIRDEMGYEIGDIRIKHEKEEKEIRDIDDEKIILNKDVSEEREKSSNEETDLQDEIESNILKEETDISDEAICNEETKASEIERKTEVNEADEGSKFKKKTKITRELEIVHNQLENKKTERDNERIQNPEADHSEIVVYDAEIKSVKTEKEKETKIYEEIEDGSSEYQKV